MTNWWWPPVTEADLARHREIAARGPRTPLSIDYIPITHDTLYLELAGWRRAGVKLSQLIEAAAAEGVVLDRTRLKESLTAALLGRDLAILVRINRRLPAPDARARR